MATKLTAADLRVGNYVYDDYSGIVEVVNINSQYSCVDYKKPTFKAVGRCDIHYLEPIQLTEEWLIKLGCKMRLALFYPFNGGANNIILNYVNGSYYPILTQEPEMSCDECKMVSLNKIDFVHEFQNLIYALTNTELTIKDDNQ